MDPSTTSPDPRVRLLGGVAGGASHGQEDTGGRLTAALDEVQVDIVLGADLTSPDRAAVLAAVGLVARLFGPVKVHGRCPSGPSWWGDLDAAAMLAAIEAMRPLSERVPGHHVVLCLGVPEQLPDAVGEYDAPELLGVGGDDWIAALSSGPIPVRTVAHGLGVQAAVCLAVGQLLGRALARAGLGPTPASIPSRGYALDLCTHRPLADPEPSVWPEAPAPDRPRRDLLPVALAGSGSVGTSVAALLAGALAPAITGAPSAPVEFTCIDTDTFDPYRNPFRYPALLGGESGAKADAVSDRLDALGLHSRSHRGGVGHWVTTRERPGFAGTVISSVDTVQGRLEVADALARETLSVGVAGLALHVQREHLGDGYACPYCDYLDAATPATQAQVHAELTGLSVERVLALHASGETLGGTDVTAAVAAGKIAGHEAARYTGARLADLVRGLYAEAAVRTPADPQPSDAEAGDADAVAVAAPHVSWFAGVLAAAEILKDIEGLPRLQRRVDVDLAGLPPGAVRTRSADPSGRCVCRSALRARWMRRLHP